MGTMIQGHRLDEAAYRGERFASYDARPGRRQRPALADQPRRDPRHPPGLPRGRAPTSSAPTPSTARASPRPTTDSRTSATSSTSLRRARPRGRRRGHDHGPAALRRGVARPDLQDGVHLARRERPRRPQRHLRRARGGVPRGGPWARRRRCRHPPDRDDLRHPERQGRDLRPRDPLRGAGPSLAGHRLRHDHRRQRTDALRPGHRGVLELRPPRAPARGGPQLRARCRGAAALRRRAVEGRRLLRVRPPQRRAAQRLR